MPTTTNHQKSFFPEDDINARIEPRTSTSCRVVFVGGPYDERVMAVLNPPSIIFQVHVAHRMPITWVDRHSLARPSFDTHWYQLKQWSNGDFVYYHMGTR